MAQPTSSLPNSQSVRFADFVVDLRARELHNNGTRVRLQEQPFQVLVLLVQRAGELITREELRRHLWPADTFVDFDNSLNAAVAKIREALGDSPDNPRFIETIPRRGYRFIAPVNGQVASAPTVPSGRASLRMKFCLVARLLVTIVLLAAAAISVYTLLHRAPPPPFQDFSISQITDNGKTVAAALSPDGKYLLSVLEDNGKQSLWLRNIATKSDTQVLPSADASYRDLIFSLDGNYIYFRKAQDSAGAGFDLFRLPVLGGRQQLIGRDFDSGISFSPDGNRIAFLRANDPEVGKLQVLTVNADGTDPRMLYSGPTSDDLGGVAWSLDGKEIASISSFPRGPLSAIDLLEVASSKMRRFAQTGDRTLGELVWLPNSRGLLTTFQPEGSWSPSRWQIGFVAYPGGAFRPIHQRHKQL